MPKMAKEPPSPTRLTSLYNFMYNPLQINSTEKLVSCDENIKNNIIDEINTNKFDVAKHWNVDSTIENVYNRLILLKEI